MTKSYTDQKELDLEDQFPFGKHKGQIVADILRDDADYLRWWIENVDDYDLTDDIQEALDDEEWRLDLIQCY